MVRARASAVVLVCSVLLLLLASHRPSSFAGPADDPSRLVVVAASWVAWGLAGYLALGLTVAAGTHLRAQRTGRPGTRPRRHPHRHGVAHRLAEVLVGATTATAVAAALPLAATADPTPAPGATAPSALDWPGLAPATPTGISAHRPAPATVIVVRPGDSLWSLTARWLGPGTTAAQVAATWPQLYAANRAVIGDRPELIHPGQRLVPPAFDPRRPR